MARSVLILPPPALVPLPPQAPPLSWSKWTFRRLGPECSVGDSEPSKHRSSSPTAQGNEANAPFSPIWFYPCRNDAGHGHRRGHFRRHHYGLGRDAKEL